MRIGKKKKSKRWKKINNNAKTFLRENKINILTLALEILKVSQLQVKKHKVI